MTAACYFCSDRWLALHCDVHGVHDPLLARGNGWSLLVDVAPVAVGHLLLVADQHAPSALSLYLEGAEPSDLFAIIDAVYFEAFGAPAAFIEHGLARFSTRHDRPCIEHAHVHVVPSGTLKNAHLDALPVVSPLRVVDDVTVDAASAPSFYSFRFDGGDVVVYAAHGTGRQYLRRVILGGEVGWQEAVRQPQSRHRYRTTLERWREIAPPVAAALCISRADER